MHLEPIWRPEVAQRNFRLLMDCMARPGKLATLAAGEASPLEAVMSCLCDNTTSVADPQNILAPSFWPLSTAQVESLENAAFCVAEADKAPSFQPQLGTLESPEFGATILLKVKHLGQGPSLEFTGPGVNERTNVQVNGLHPDWLKLRAQWNSGFPMGVDFILLDEHQLICVPRTTQIRASSWDM